MRLCALSIFAIVALIAFELVSHSQISLHRFGWHFFVGSAWNPVTNEFGALPFIYGTIVSSLVALALAVPLAVGVAVFITEMCPKMLRGPLSFVTELLAAIPSVVYGLWAIFVLVPLLHNYVNPLLIKVLGWTGLFTAPDFWDWDVRGGRDSGHHDSADYFFSDARSDERGAACAARGGAGAGGDAVGDDPRRRAAQCADWHCGRGDFGTGAGAGRDDGGRDGDWEQSNDFEVAAGAGGDDGERDCE
jgi:hypothetical protein